MGFLFKQKVTRPLPRNAVLKEKRRKATKRELKADPSRLSIVETTARWRDRSGEFVEGVVVGSNRVRMESATWSAKYGDGIIQTVSTGCRDKSAAAAMLSELESTADRVRAGVMTTLELSTADASQSPIASHVADYETYLKNQPGKGKRDRVSVNHVINAVRCVHRICEDFVFKTLQSIERETASIECSCTVQNAGRYQQSKAPSTLT